MVDGFQDMGQRSRMMTEIGGGGAATVQHSFKHMNFTPLTTFNRVTSSDTNENDGCATNGKMIAVAWNAAATIAVFNANRALSFDANTPLIKGHQGNIYDMSWSPFQDRLLATCADDGNAKFWIFDDDYEGLTGKSNMIESAMEIEAHQRKCISI